MRCQVGNPRLAPLSLKQPMRIPGTASTSSVTEDRGAPRSSVLAGVIANPLVRAGLVLGMGFGGLADGIVLHSILGWHHLICADATVYCQPTSIEQLQLENTQDGYFDLALWIVLLAGTAMMSRAARNTDRVWSGRVLLGSSLAGCGLFNFLEGLVDHQILGIHHVLPGSPHQFLFDMLYLGNGLLFFGIGAWLVRSPGNSSR
jgi:uncharacterized membrane protein